MIAFILNGPAGIGKDTLANMTGLHRLEFKTGLYQSAGKLFDIEPDHLRSLNESRDTKEVKVWEWRIPGTSLPIGGMSPREVLIHTSEFVVKPLLGRNYFGQLAAKAALSVGAQWCVFSDGGFKEEAEALINAGIKPVIIRLHCEGMTFEGDSRGYLNDIPGACFHDVDCPRGKVHNSFLRISSIMSEYGTTPF